MKRYIFYIWSHQYENILFIWSNGYVTSQKLEINEIFLNKRDKLIFVILILNWIKIHMRIFITNNIYFVVAQISKSRMQWSWCEGLTLCPINKTENIYCTNTADSTASNDHVLYWIYNDLSSLSFDHNSPKLLAGKIKKKKKTCYSSVNFFCQLSMLTERKKKHWKFLNWKKSVKNTHVHISNRDLVL